MKSKSRFRLALGLAALAGLLLLHGGGARGQTFQSLGSASLSVTTSTGRVALPATTFGNNITVLNVGTAEAFVNFGGSTVTAATTNESVPAGSGRCFAQQGFTNVAGITASGSTTLRISQGTGPCSISFRGGGAAAGLTVGTSVITGGTDTRVLFDNAGVVGEYAISGTGSVAMTTSPAFTTPAVGVATGTSLALGGATIGSNALAVTGTAAISGVLTGKAASGSTAPSFSFADMTNAGLYGITGTGEVVIASAGQSALGVVAGARVSMQSIQLLGWTSSSTAAVGVAQDTIIARQGAANVQLGGITSATTAVAQTLSAIGSSGNSAAAALFTIAGSDQTGTTTTGGGVKLRGGNGTSAGGTVEIWTSATTTPAVAASWAANKDMTQSGQFFLPNITTDATKTDTSVCQDTTTHQFYSGTGTLGICLGTSSMRFKEKIVPETDGMVQLASLQPKNFFYRPGYGDSGAREQYGFLAEDVVHVLPKLVGLDVDGKPNTVDMLGMIPIIVRALQEQQTQIADIKKRIH